jgi:aspartokinase
MGGIPVGFVYSAPEGFTRSLAEMLKLSLAKEHEEARRMFHKSMQGLFEAWVLAREDMKALISTGNRAEYDAWITALELQIRQDMRGFTMQIEEVFSPKSAVHSSLAEALVLSMGERSFEKIVIAPMFETLNKFSGRRFACIDPLQEICARSGQEGYTDLEPDVEKSVERLQNLIAFRLKREGDNLSFVMPGFYMAKEVGFPAISTMPLNGSDRSAYILYQALRADLVYVKHLTRPLPDSVVSLIDDQERQPFVDGKKSELIATSVLVDLRKLGLGIRIFDPTKNKHYYLPSHKEQVEYPSHF